MSVQTVSAEMPAEYPKARAQSLGGVVLLSSVGPSTHVSEYFIGEANPQAEEVRVCYALNPRHQRATELARMVVKGWSDYQQLDEVLLRQPKIAGELYDDARRGLVATSSKVLQVALEEARWEHVGTQRYSALELAVNAKYDLAELTERVEPSLAAISDNE